MTNIISKFIPSTDNFLDKPVERLAIDVKSKLQVLGMAELAANAYFVPNASNSTSWRNTTGLWTYEYSYGWKVDGLRGHIFKSTVEKTIVISAKGTSLNSKKDKESANLICSCNCCFDKCSNECDKEKLLESLPNMYISLMLKAYENVLEKYPDHDVVFTGHSMGSVVASLAAIQTCNLAVGFSAPGEQLFAERINMTHNCPTSKKSTVHHFGYSKDPIFTGTCGWMCSLFGYKMDSLCHHGKVCTYGIMEEKEKEELDFEISYKNYSTLYENVDLLGSGMIYTHKIDFLIDKIIIPSETVPECVFKENCTEKCS